MSVHLPLRMIRYAIVSIEIHNGQFDCPFSGTAAFFKPDEDEQLDPRIEAYLLLCGRRLAYGVYYRGPVCGLWLVVRNADGRDDPVIALKYVKDGSWMDIVDAILVCEYSDRATLNGERPLRLTSPNGDVVLVIE